MFMSLAIMRQRIRIIGVTVLLAAASVNAQSVVCDPMTTANRLGNYNNPADADYLRIVHRGHFNTNVETLARGLSSSDPMVDIRYTLRRFPNHHRALNSMSRYYYAHEDSYLYDGYTMPECYFQWAMDFQPTDGSVVLVHAIHLHRGERYAEAQEQYQLAIDMMPDSAEAHYNFGLLYVDMDNPADARLRAISAYQLGFPLQGLKDRLRRRKAWTVADDRALQERTLPAATDDR